MALEQGIEIFYAWVFFSSSKLNLARGWFGIYRNALRRKERNPGGDLVLQRPLLGPFGEITQDLHKGISAFDNVLGLALDKLEDLQPPRLWDEEGRQITIRHTLRPLWETIDDPDSNMFHFLQTYAKKSGDIPPELLSLILVQSFFW